MELFTAITMINRPISIFPNYRSKIWWASFIMAVLLMLFFISVTVYASGFGGYISEKLIGRSGVSDSNLLIGRSGVSSSLLDVAMSGIVAVAGVTDIYMDGAGTHATLHGNLQSLNGFPQATVRFQWGYDASYGNATTSQVMAAVGMFTADIQHFDPSKTVYYRAVVEADGTNYSPSSTFMAAGGIVSGFNLLNAVVLVAYISMVIFTVIEIGKKSAIAALILMAVAIYLGEAFIVAIQETIRSLF